MKQTLYISDLDGTLFNNKAQLTEYTVDVINRFVQQGGLFSIATGRTYESAWPIIQALDLRLPLIFSNGVITYDPLEQRYISVAKMNTDSMKKVDQILDAYEMRGFFYMMQDHKVHIFHKPFLTTTESEFYDRRVDLYSGRLHEVSDIFASTKNYHPFFAVAYGPQEKMTELAQQINQVPSMQTALYADVYNKNYFMDIFPSDVSKLSGMQTVQKISRADRTVSFGDNYNDLPMLEGANESYATSGAVAEAKAVATQVIGHHNEDGVARFLAERFSL